MKHQLYLLFFLLICVPFVGQSQDLKKNTDDFSIQIDKKDASDGNTADAYIKLTIVGGVPPFRINTFSPYNAPSETIGDNLNLINIKSGDYLFIVRDASGKAIKKEISIINQR